MSRRHEHRVLRVAALWGVTVAVAAGVGWWAAQQVVVTPDEPLPEPEPVLYTVEDGSVGRSLSFAASAEWELVPLTRNAAAGIVTSVDHEDGAAAAPGAVIYRVDLRPVVVGQGSVPSFRDLSRGDEGPDVRQFQQLLADLGHYVGEVDGAFGTGTRRAVERWQEELGVQEDGIVRRGDVVWVPDLPARLVLDDGVSKGARLQDGENAVLLAPDEPTVTVTLAQDQRDLVPSSADVAVTHPDGSWDGRIGRATESVDTGDYVLELVGPDGGPVCADECDDVLPLDQRTALGAEIIVIPETSGPVVPSAALRSRPEGRPFVTSAEGDQVAVDIVAATDGLAVVEGIDPGARIVLFEASDEGSAPQDDSR